MEGKSQYIEFAGNLVPITKSGEQLQFSFRAFRENRLPFSVRVKDQHAEAVGRCLFMREPKVNIMLMKILELRLKFKSNNAYRLQRVNHHNSQSAY